MVVAAAAEVAAPRVGLPPVMLALAIGVLLGNVLEPARRKTLAPGLQLFTKKVLKLAIVVLGLKLTAEKASLLEPRVFALIAACLVVALLAGAALGRAFGATPRVRLLLGCGTAICGATAVVTIAPLVDAKDDEVAFSIATIFLFNLVALFAFPAIGHAMHLSEQQFVSWVGTAVNDTSAVVATARAWSPGADAGAAAVKLIRTLALVPMAVVVASLGARWRETATEKKVSIYEVFPWFVLGFALMALAATFLPLPKPAVAWALTIAGWAITAVLAAVGLNLDLRKTLGAGSKALALGFQIALLMAGVSLGLIHLLGIR
jgi:uncharacterized integral membrane protein (TIGR00698 family)